jgi:hypothetical protein
MCAATHLRDAELRACCHGADRHTTHIFTDERGDLLTHSTLDGILAEMLTFCYDKAIASTHSWHSVRIGLACALHAAGAPDEVIQLLCRWVSIESLRLYRRVGVSRNILWCDAAELATVDTRQLGNLPILDGSDSFAALQAPLNAEAAPKQARPRQQAAQAQAPERVMVPRELWPDYPCDELQGKGWEALVVGRSERGVQLAFANAKTKDGVPYQRVTLDPAVLTPLPPTGAG